MATNTHDFDATHPDFLHVYVLVFDPLNPCKANTICILHTNCALARSAPNWLIDLRFTHLPEDYETALRDIGIKLPSNLRIGVALPLGENRMNCTEINQVLHYHDRDPSSERLFRTWVEHWRGELAGHRAAVYTRNFFFFFMLRELGPDTPPLLTEVHRLGYWKYLEQRMAGTPRAKLAPRLRQLRETEADLIGQAQKVMCISETIARKLHQVRPGLNIEILRSGFEPPKQLIETPPLDDRARDIELLYTGQLYDWKGVHVLIEALRHCDPRIRLTLVGGNSPADRAVMQQIAHHLGVWDRVEWIGQVPHTRVYDYQRRARLSVVPLTSRFRISKWYTSPMKVFELLAAGSPLLVADLPTLRDFLRPGVTAEFARADDPRDWGRKIEALLANPEHRYRMARNGLEYARDFSYPRRGEKIRDAIASVAFQSSKSSLVAS